MPDNLVDDEAEEFFREFGVQLGLFRKLSEPRDLAFLAPRVRRGKPAYRLVPPDGLRHLEAFGE